MMVSPSARGTECILSNLNRWYGDTKDRSVLSVCAKTSCRAERAVLFAEGLIEEIAAPIPHRHIVFTIPNALRGLLQRERRLLGLLSRCAYEAVLRAFVAYPGSRQAIPGFVASIQTFSSCAADFHPHIDGLVTEGAFSATGDFLSVGSVNEAILEGLFLRLRL
jgi:hypothetical protein